MASNPRELMSAPIRWTLLAWGLQVIITTSLAVGSFISQVAGVAAAMTIAAIVTLGTIPRSWPDGASRSRAARTVWLGACFAAGLDTYLLVRLMSQADRPTAFASAVVIGLAVAFLSPEL